MLLEGTRRFSKIYVGDVELKIFYIMMTVFDNDVLFFKFQALGRM